MNMIDPTRKLLFTFLIALIGLSSWAQPQELSTKNKKAIKSFELARKFYDRYELENAELFFREAIDHDENFYEARVILGELLTDRKKYSEAVEQFELAIALKPDEFPNLYLASAHLQLKLERYEDARKNAAKFLTYDRLPPNMQSLAKKTIANCEFAQVAIKNPVPFEPINMGPGINSPLMEYFPCITADDQTFLYTRRLEKDQRSPRGLNEDFYISTRTGGDWPTSKNIGAPINSALNEGAPTLAPDGQTIIFTACEFQERYSGGKRGFGSCDLFMTRRVGKKWTAPANLGGKINSNNWESQPSFSADGTTLYFVRGIKTRGGVKGQDIYVSKRLENGGWTPATRIKGKVNTPGREESVFIHPDGKTLYFSSDGHPGMGGLDIYVSRLQDNGEWGEPTNLGYPINTSQEENSLLVSASGKLAYFASDREGGLGGLDLYHFELHEAVRPEPVTYMKGKVYDAKTKAPLKARFELVDLASGDVVVQSYSNEADGEFLVCIPVNRDYALNATKEGYIIYSENFTLTESPGTEPYKKNVPMDKFRKDVKFVLKNIFFATDKFDLQPESEIELDRLVKVLETNPKLKIEVGGHTDNQGSESHNLTLSDNRAKAVRDYLISKGIAADRLTSKGYGQSVPIATNDTPEGRRQNRRTEFTIVDTGEE